MCPVSPCVRSLKLVVAYDGGGYAGWQFQPDRPTIQGALEDAWQQITGERLRMAGSGRTDAGVHALGQVVSLESRSHLECDTLLRGLNAKLPTDIVVLNIEEAPIEFHASRDALRKAYRYQIHNGKLPDVFQRSYAWHVSHPLAERAMQQAGDLLVGRHDFASFQSAGSPRDCTVRTVFRVAVARGSGPLAERITIDVEGDGFLYNMVRAIAGTLVEVGRGNRPPSWVGDVLAACDRCQAGRTAPAHGLFLVRVDYA